MTLAQTVAGIDVGGTRKGFHAVALRGTRIVATLATCSAGDIVAWCRTQRASVVGIDAPCRWSRTGRARSCEQQLARLGVSCFATPSRAIGQSHPFYRWMVNVAELYQRLRPYYRLYDGRSAVIKPVCFETFPQAIACSLAGRTVSAKRKTLERRRLLEHAGLVTGDLTCIDDLDAALCALAAQLVLAGRFTAYGDRVEGLILVPTCP
jgi:predicted nuclease with RNAse H fold